MPGETCITVPSNASTAATGPESGMREPEPAARPGHADLAAVQVAGEDDIDPPGSEPGQDVGEMAEQDAQIGAHVEVRGGVVVRLAEVALGGGAGQREAPAVERELRRRAIEQLEAAEVAGVPALRERIAAAREVVVAEHGVGAVAGGRDELGGGRREPRSGPAACDEIPRDRNEVGLQLARPLRAPAEQAEPRPEARVHVRDMQDRERLELARQAGDGEIAHAFAERQGLCAGGRDSRCGCGCQRFLPSHHRWYSRSRNAAGSAAREAAALELQN